jgi:hypothetical protein
MKSPLARFRLPSERPAGSGDFVPKILDGTLAASTALLWTLPWPPWNMSYRWRVSFSERENEPRGELPMKKLTLAIATAAMLATAAPAMAFGVHVGVGGVGVGVGVPGPYYGYGPNCGYWNNYCNGGGYYDYYGGPGVVIGGGGWHGGHGHWHGHR